MKKQPDKSSLEQLYCQAIYQTESAEQPLIFKIGQKNARLDELLDERHATWAVFITAYNPASERQPEAVNRRNNERLLEKLVKGGYQFVAGYGTDAAQQWPQEASWLVFNLPMEKAELLAIEFGQNAYVLVRRNEPPLLCWTQQKRGS